MNSWDNERHVRVVDPARVPCCIQYFKILTRVSHPSMGFKSHRYIKWINQKPFEALGNFILSFIHEMAVVCCCSLNNCLNLKKEKKNFKEKSGWLKTLVSAALLKHSAVRTSLSVAASGSALLASTQGGNGCVRWETRLSKWLYCLVFNNWSIHQRKSAAQVCLLVFAEQMKWKDEIIIKRKMKLTKKKKKTAPELTLSERKWQTVSVVSRQVQGILSMYERKPVWV